MRATSAGKACAWCAAQLNTGRKFCGMKCYADSLRRPITGICLGCGNVFSRKRQNRDSGKYCSRQCAFNDPAWKAMTAEKAAKYRPVVDRVAIASRLAERQRVRAERRAEKERLRLERAELERVRFSKVHNRTCKGCGAAYAKPVRASGLLFYCSDACRDAARLQARRRGRQKAGSKFRDRCRHYGVPYTPGIGPISVCARDKWTCRLCGAKTPKRLRGTFKPNAPEVDHIVPLSYPGSPGHVWSNVQCACRKCNIEKAGRPLGQQMLRLEESAA